MPPSEFIPSTPASSPPAAIASGVEYAGFWRRAGAFVIDWLILRIASSPFDLIVGFNPGFGMDAFRPRDLTPEDYVFGLILPTIISWLYSALMESSPKQATLGKMALGIVVTDLRGSRISFGRATRRYFAKILSAVILLIGFLMVLWTPRKQGLHDQIAETLVVRGKRPGP